MKKGLVLVVAMSVLGLAACSTIEDKVIEAGGKQVDTKGITKMISDETVYGTTSGGQHFVIYFYDNGAMRISAANGRFRDTGTWTVANSVLCYKWMTPEGNRCKKLFKMPDGRIAYTTGDGKQGFFDKFVGGNVEHL